MKATKGLKVRKTGGVDLGKTCSARIMGGARGFDDACAIEGFSNDLAPTIKCLQGFTIIVEVEDEQDNRSEGGRT